MPFQPQAARPKLTLRLSSFYRHRTDSFPHCRRPFATQAILPSLARLYGVMPAAIGFAVNACTLGMAVSGLAVGYFSREIDRRKGILISLVLLSIPTALLASAPNLTVFTVLRVAQGLCMASAFTLTLAYLGEHYSAVD